MMYVIWGLVGALLGFALQQEFFTTVFGAMLGIAWARMSGLRRDIDLARKELAEAKRIFGRSPRTGEAPGAVAPTPAVVEHRLPDIGASPLPELGARSWRTCRSSTLSSAAMPSALF